jgi:hypothetical protein
VDAESTARFLWAAWDGVICSHLGPSNMGLTDTEFEAVLNRARRETGAHFMDVQAARFMLMFM